MTRHDILKPPAHPAHARTQKSGSSPHSCAGGRGRFFACRGGVGRGRLDDGGTTAMVVGALASAAVVVSTTSMLLLAVAVVAVAAAAPASSSCMVGIGEVCRWSWLLDRSRPTSISTTQGLA